MSTVEKQLVRILEDLFHYTSVLESSTSPDFIGHRMAMVRQINRLHSEFDQLMKEISE